MDRVFLLPKSARRGTILGEVGHRDQQSLARSTERLRPRLNGYYSFKIILYARGVSNTIHAYIIAYAMGFVKRKL